VLALLVALIYHVVNRQEPIVHHSMQQQLGGMSAEGVGGDPELNVQKNRVTAPVRIEDVSPRDIVAIPDDLLLNAGKRMRRKWDAATREYLAKSEARGMRVTGYIIAAKESGLESCNGNIDSLRDYHIWIGDDAGASKGSSVVVEVTPRWKAVHPEWRLRFFSALARQHAKVRVTGWLMWDEEHASEVHHSRSTCWEVHPITMFEVWSGGGWRQLSEEYASN
jgi:hypothetical protein